MEKKGIGRRYLIGILLLVLLLGIGWWAARESRNAGYRAETEHWLEPVENEQGEKSFLRQADFFPFSAEEEGFAFLMIGVEPLYYQEGMKVSLFMDRKDIGGRAVCAEMEPKADRQFSATVKVPTDEVLKMGVFLENKGRNSFRLIHDFADIKVENGEVIYP